MIQERKYPGHFAAAFIPQVSPDGTVQVMVIGVLPVEYKNADGETQKKFLQVKLPGGCAENDTENENLFLALTRELRYEIGEGRGEDLTVAVFGEIFRRLKRSRVEGQSDHQQAFFKARVSGMLRQEQKLEDEGDEILTPPMYSEVRQLMKVLFPSHREPLMAGLDNLARTNAGVAHEYEDVLADWHAGKLQEWSYPSRSRRRSPL